MHPASQPVSLFSILFIYDFFGHFFQDYMNLLLMQEFTCRVGFSIIANRSLK